MPQLNESKVDLFAGETRKLNLVHVSGESFKSSDPSVVTVTENGKIKAIGKGSAEIIVNYFGQKFKCVVNVSEPTLNFTEKTLSPGEIFTLKLNQVKADRFKTTNSAVATIDENGLVAAISPGKVSVKAVYKGHVYACKIIVKEIESTESPQK